MKQKDFMNLPGQNVKIGDLKKTVKTGFMDRLTRETSQRMSGDLQSGYNGVDNVAQTIYQPGGEQVQNLKMGKSGY